MKSVSQCFCAQHIQRRLQALCTITKREASGRLQSGLALVSDWILPESSLHSVVCITVSYRAVRTSSLCVKTEPPFFSACVLSITIVPSHLLLAPPPSHGPLTFSPHVSSPLLSSPSPGSSSLFPAACFFIPPLSLFTAPSFASFSHDNQQAWIWCHSPPQQTASDSCGHHPICPAAIRGLGTKDEQSSIPAVLLRGSSLRSPA